MTAQAGVHAWNSPLDVLRSKRTSPLVCIRSRTNPRISTQLPSSAPVSACSRVTKRRSSMFHHPDRRRTALVTTGTNSPSLVTPSSSTIVPGCMALGSSHFGLTTRIPPLASSTYAKGVLECDQVTTARRLTGKWRPASSGLKSRICSVRRKGKWIGGHHQGGSGWVGRGGQPIQTIVQTRLHAHQIRIANGFDSIPEPQRLALFALNHDLSRGIPKGDPLARFVAAHDALHPNRGACRRVRQYVFAQSDRNGRSARRFSTSR